MRPEGALPAGSERARARARGDGPTGVPRGGRSRARRGPMRRPRGVPARPGRWPRVPTRGRAAPAAARTRSDRVGLGRCRPAAAPRQLGSISIQDSGSNSLGRSTFRRRVGLAETEGGGAARLCRGSLSSRRLGRAARLGLGRPRRHGRRSRTPPPPRARARAERGGGGGTCVETSAGYAGPPAGDAAGRRLRSLRRSRPVRLAPAQASMRPARTSLHGGRRVILISELF